MLMLLPIKKILKKKTNEKIKYLSVNPKICSHIFIIIIIIIIIIFYYCYLLLLFSLYYYLSFLFISLFFSIILYF